MGHTRGCEQEPLDLGPENLGDGRDGLGVVAPLEPALEVLQDDPVASSRAAGARTATAVAGRESNSEATDPRLPAETIAHS